MGFLCPTCGSEIVAVGPIQIIEYNADARSTRVLQVERKSWTFEASRPPPIDARHGGTERQVTIRFFCQNHHSMQLRFDGLPDPLSIPHGGGPA